MGTIPRSSFAKWIDLYYAKTSEVCLEPKSDLFKSTKSAIPKTLN